MSLTHIDLPDQYIKTERGGNMPSLLIYNNRIGTLSDWGQEVGITRAAIWQRLERMPIADALKPPERRKYVTGHVSKRRKFGDPPEKEWPYLPSGLPVVRPLL